MSKQAWALVSLMLLGTAVSAQTAAGGPVPPMPTVDPAMCDALASMPNAPMTVQACRSMLQLAKDDPAAHRPGDAAMSCADIFAELKVASASMGVSDAEAARRQQIVRDAQTLNERHGARAAAATAPNTAALQALAVVAAVVPSAVTAPLIAAQQADLQAKGKVAADAYVVEARQITSESASAVASTMRDPRAVRLSHLAEQKDCKAPAR